MKTMAPALLVLASSLALTACSSSSDDLQTWMKDQAHLMKGQVTPLPPVYPFNPITYIGKEMSDPFAPKKSIKIANNAPDSTRKKDFLESFSMERLTVVGAIKRNGQLWGLVRAPDGTVTMVKPGDYIGQNFGKIMEIRDNGIHIKESVLDPQGDWTDREVDLGVAAASAPGGR